MKAIRGKHASSLDIATSRIRALEAELAEERGARARAAIERSEQQTRAEKAEAEVERLKKYLNEQPALPDPADRFRKEALEYILDPDEPVERECGT